MKNKILFVPMILTLLIIGIHYVVNKSNSGNKFTVTASYIQVVNKEETKNAYSITTINPMEKNTNNTLVIWVNEENVWNLIKEGEVYFVSYKQPTNNSHAMLLRINYPAD